MNVPWLPCRKISREDWHEIRHEMIFRNHKWDPRIGDVEVLADYALVLKAEAWNELAGAAEELAAEIMAIEEHVLRRRDMHKRLAANSKLCSALKGAVDISPIGMARQIRFDFHWTRQGWMISEANTDVPGGYIEAGALPELMRRFYEGTATAGNPARQLAQQVAAEVNGKGIAGLVHASAYTDDRQVMVYIARELNDARIASVLINPEQVLWRDGRAYAETIAGKSELGGIIRFFPAEWLVNLGRRSGYEHFFGKSTVAQSNPATAVLIQNKRLPLVWNELATVKTQWRKYLPETKDVREVRRNDLEEWVIKPALGRVGEMVGISGISKEKEWNQIVKAAYRYPDYWVAQRRFDAVAFETEDGPMYPCIGVFTIGGKACGTYGRLNSYAIIDQYAKEAAVLINAT